MEPPSGSGEDAAAAGYLYKSVAGVVLDKIISVLFGLAAAVFGSTVFPIADIVFGLYDPLTDFLGNYIEFSVAIVIASAVTWGYTLRRKPALALAFHGAVAVAALVVAGMMRRGIGLPTAVGAQFLFYFAGILIACEMAVIVFVQGVWAAIKLVKVH